MDLAARGHALVLHLATEDCEARFQLFVDEEPPERARDRGTIVLSGANLRVPGGLLRADGLEFLSRPGEVRVDSEAEETAIPAGEYSVEVLDLLSWKVRHRIAEGRRGLGWRDKGVHRLVSVYTWLGIVLFPGNLLVAPLVVAGFWRSRGWRGALAATAIVLALDGLVIAGSWLLQAARRRFAIFSRVAEADAAFERENPDIVVLLRTRAREAEGGPAAWAHLRIPG